MATKIFMEALSPTMEEGRLVKWNQPEGAAVKSGDVLAEVETDKAVMELVARGDGVLRKQFVAEGTTVPVGSVVGVIAGADEDIAAIVGGAGGAAAPAAASAPAPAASVPAAASAAPAAPVAPPAPVATGAVRSSPLARRLAKESGVDLTAIPGSGPAGRVIKRDIEAALAGGSPAASPPSAVRRPPSPEGDYRDESLTQIRKTIAKRLSESIGPIPTFYLTAEFDMTRAVEMRSQAVSLGDEYKVSVNDIILKAVATALANHPEVNAHWLGDRIRYHHRVHLGMAVATDDGLIVPVIFDANQKGLQEISQESRELAKKARERKLKPEEYTGSTFSVSNLGMMQIDQFTAIINPPEVGILAIGAVEDTPAVVDGAVVIRKRMRVTMSCDHRVIDGAVGARFLQDLRRMIENPLLLVF
ncbi:MAG: 2-oxo acid dehydrogenase subunit E2 [Gemmatimonadaceae bacterium]|nr:2-oxo acid dehydrogenase subunit E2 [Gemmatimonadaceae bacterium]